MTDEDYHKKVELARNHNNPVDTYLYTHKTFDEIIEKHKNNYCEVCTDSRIVRSPNILHNKLRIRRTRIPIQVIKDNLIAGLSHDEIIEQYPILEKEDIEAVVQYSLEETNETKSNNIY